MPRKKGSVIKTSRRQAPALGLCGARTMTPGAKSEFCTKSAGWGTTHKGLGRCKFHGGTAKGQRAKAVRDEAIQFMGAPKDINPLDAIIWCIKITAGEVEWLSGQIAEIQQENWIEEGLIGKQMNIFQRARADAQDRLVRYSKEAISLGLAERAVRLAEQFGTTIARLLEGIYAEMELSTAQKKKWKIVIRKHLILMEGGRVVDNDDRNMPLKMLPPGRSVG